MFTKLLIPVLVAGAALALTSKRSSASPRVTIDRPTTGGAAPLPRKSSPITGTPRNSAKKPGTIDTPVGKIPRKPTPGRTSPGQPIGTQPVAPKVPSAAMLAAIAQALASGNPKLMRAVAAKLRQFGFIEQATDLENAARAIEAGQMIPGLPGIVTPPVPVIPPPAVRPPPAARPRPIPVPKPPRALPEPQEPEITDPNPRRALALRVQRMLATHPPGTENKELLKTFQTQEGLKADGLYGYGSGLAMLKYNLVPPKPRTTLTAQRKKDWRGNLLYQAKKDPVRAAEYQAAAEV